MVLWMEWKEFLHDMMACLWYFVSSTRGKKSKLLVDGWEGSFAILTACFLGPSLYIQLDCFGLFPMILKARFTILCSLLQSEDETKAKTAEFRSWHFNICHSFLFLFLFFILKELKQPGFRKRRRNNTTSMCLAKCFLLSHPDRHSCLPFHCQALLSLHSLLKVPAGNRGGGEAGCCNRESEKKYWQQYALQVTRRQGYHNIQPLTRRRRMGCGGVRGCRLRRASCQFGTEWNGKVQKIQEAAAAGVACLGRFMMQFFSSLCCSRLHYFMLQSQICVSRALRRRRGA